MADKSGEKSHSDNVLDDLIKITYEELKKNIKEQAKLGDLLKMIELKRKLSPADGDQKKFWKMLDQIRKQNLEQPEKKLSKKKNRKKK